MSHSKYDFAHCSKIVELGKEGYSITEMAMALDVSVTRLYFWEKEYPEFSEAFDRARDYSAAFINKEGRLNLKNRSFNSRTHELMWHGANYHVNSRYLKNSIKSTKDPHEQCYLILEAMVGGMIDHERATSMINAITSTHQLIDFKEIKNEVDELKVILTNQKAATDGNNIATNKGTATAG